jgi:uncharacterized small protein (DUF1192 family)
MAEAHRFCNHFRRSSGSGIDGDEAFRRREQAMRDPDTEPLKQTPSHTIGEDLSRLSLSELIERIALLQAEIGRIEAARQAKSSAQTAADSFFRTGASLPS